MRLLILIPILLLTGCNTMPPPRDTPANPARAVMPAAETTVLADASAPALALSVSRALFKTSPAVVVSDNANVSAASEKAVSLGVPLLLAPPQTDPFLAQVQAEVARLAPRSVITFGAVSWVSPSPALANAAADDIKPDAPLDKLLVLGMDDAVSKAALASAKATGARIVLLKNPDPRTSPEAIAALSKQDTGHVLALGAAFGNAALVRERVNTAAAGVMLPGGGQILFPARRMVALYGHPGDTKLGSLGEQDVAASVARARNVASAYQALVKEPVIPSFDLIATVASSGAGSDGDYSSEASIAFLRPWVDAAAKAGMYVVLDLQPGLSDFTSQAKRYAELLSLPNVGLALDPEWRLKPGQKHMQQIGSVDAAEINQTSAWLAGLTRDNKLPQKLLLLHEFRLDMITNRSTLDTSHDELQIVIHADGFGSHGVKMDTWRALNANPPANIFWGWKNFYDEDKPTYTPAETYSVSPSPFFVSYQ